MWIKGRCLGFVSRRSHKIVRSSSRVWCLDWLGKYNWHRIQIWCWCYNRIGQYMCILKWVILNSNTDNILINKLDYEQDMRHLNNFIVFISNKKALNSHAFGRKIRISSQLYHSNRFKNSDKLLMRVWIIIKASYEIMH